MKGFEISFIPDRLIAEPVVFRGLSDSELVTSAIASMLLCVPAFTIIFALMGILIVGVGVGFIASMLAFYFISGYFQKLKRTMPDGLHMVYLRKLLQRKFSFINFNYIDSDGHWDIRRSRRVSKIQNESE